MDQDLAATNIRPLHWDEYDDDDDNDEDDIKNNGNEQRLKHTYRIRDRYMLRQIIVLHIPNPVQCVVRSYFHKIFHAHPWMRFESGRLPQDYAIDVFLAWLCTNHSGQHFGKWHSPYIGLCYC